MGEMISQDAPSVLFAVGRTVRGTQPPKFRWGVGKIIFPNIFFKAWRITV